MQPATRQLRDLLHRRGHHRHQQYPRRRSHPADPVDLATVTSYITHTVRRFGDWHLDLTPPEAPVVAHLRLPAPTP
ncbi:MAG TPA: hypothetical protein VGL46_10430 [Pseudonocardiaceae bacterium]